MATEYFETACNSHNIGGFAVNYSGDEIVDNTTGFLGNNGGGDQLAPESADLNRLVECHQVCGHDSKQHQSGWWLGPYGSSLVTGHNDPCSAREGVQPPNDLALGAGNHLDPGFNPFAASLATSIPEVPTGDSLTGNAIYNTSASFIYDGNLIQTPADCNSIPLFAIPPVVDVGQRQLTPEINPLPASHGVADNSPDGKPACVCGKTFARPDSRKRHIDGASRRHFQCASRRHPSGVIPATIGARTPAGLFPCMMCNRRRGANGFARRDNLRQHLEVYHKLSKEFIDEYFRTYH